ncbi:IS6 family transposase [Methylovirgula sp. 4M-Z18]|uniref:IS6 family transposase n=1 Tax=Methylovirgula sp. 4M-Z18 TaxID=2293567 RepID=UPI001FE12992|nr:IS6 family transposase [Methylovirgula sp. 4M-Z18]
MGMPSRNYEHTDRELQANRFPPQIIAHAVWLHFRFPLSLRLAEEMLLERGVVVSYETIRRWAMKFGPDYARRARRNAPSRLDIWYLDEVVITINGEKRYLWQAVDHEGYVLDEIVQIHRNTKAARRLLTRLLRKQGCAPKRIITDKLGSYAAARRELMSKVEHRQHKRLNNRAENSHVPIRRRERMMQGFRSWPGLPRFVSTFSAVRNHFVPSHTQRSALSTHLRRLSAMMQWKSVTGAA